MAEFQQKTFTPSVQTFKTLIRSNRQPLNNSGYNNFEMSPIPPGMTIARLAGMHALIVKHVASEGPGLIERWLREYEIPHDVLDLWAMPFPKIDDLTHIVLLGGPMNVYQEEEYPFLKQEDLFIREAIRKGKRLLGICLGAQLIAKSLGARVSKAFRKEIGWYDVSLTRLGIRDPFFSGLPKTFPVFQWHEDTFDVPSGADLIITSDPVPNQGFRFGKEVYALQFHLEMTPEMIKEWTAAPGPEEDALEPAPFSALEIQAATETRIEKYTQRGIHFIKHFFSEGAFK